MLYDIMNSLLNNCVARPQVSKEGEEQSSDTDSGCYLISLEDEDLQEDNTCLSVIPRDNLVPGSVLGQSCLVTRSSGKVLA